MAPVKNKTARILVVEDSPTQAEGVRYLLEQQGYCASIARNGNEAVESIRAHRPDLVISDIIMPEMDGFELCREIKMEAGLRNIPVILLTALSDAGDILKGLECGADNFITKPYNPAYLMSRIEDVLSPAKNSERQKAEKGIEITFEKRKYFITSGRERILDLLLSTYETAVIKNRQLLAAQQELKQANIMLQTEIAERKRAEAAINDSLREKEILLKELYHRTKNNMNSVSNLITLQSSAIKDPEIRQLLKETQGRINSMALVHEMLYKTGDLSRLDLKDYLEQLARSVLASPRKIKLYLDLDPVPATLDVAIPCGLILNELLSNSLKHAFPDGRGEISVSLKKKGNEVELVCSDNGPGFPEGFKVETTGSLGLKLINGLVKQLLGSIETLRGNGAGLAVRFDISRLQEK